MNREEFMRQLEELLSEISEEERKEALEYYRGYFEDAGEENEERILRELESPEKVVQTIKADLGMITLRETEKRETEEPGYPNSQPARQDSSTGQSSTEGNGAGQNSTGDSPTGQSSTEQSSAEGSGTGQRSTEDSSTGQNSTEGSGTGQNSTEGSRTEQSYEEAGKANDSGWKILLIIAAAVITSPIWGTMLGLLLAGVMMIVFGLFGFLIAAAAVAGTLSITGVSLVGIGIGQLTASGAAVGTALMGAGFLVLALAVLAILGCVWLYGRAVPWLVRTAVRLCQRLFFRRRRNV